MTYWHYYSINAQLLVWPYPLCCDWSMGAVAVVSSWSPHVPSVGGGSPHVPFCFSGLIVCPLLARPLVSPHVPSSCLPSCFTGVWVRRLTWRWRAARRALTW
jgi:hypothetical protein